VARERKVLLSGTKELWNSQVLSFDGESFLQP